jgi:hypothetical protein
MSSDTIVLTERPRVDRVSSEVDFSHDFTEFVDRKKLVRFDLRDLEFEAFETSSEAFAGFQTKVAAHRAVR